MVDKMSNWRKLCAELLQGLDENRHPEVRYPGHLRLVMAAARTALAAEQGPAAPDWVREAFAELERRQEKLHRFRDLRTALAAEPPAPNPHEVLAARPLLEAVARMGDRIGQHTVGEITVISDRAAAWLAENPPGQPVAIEPRGCPTPGACSCVEPPAPEADAALSLAAIIRSVDGSHSLGAAALADAILSHPDAASVFQFPAPAPTVNDIFELCEDHEFHLGSDGADEEESAESLLEIIRVALARWGKQPPAPAPVVEEDDGDDVIDRWIDSLPGWPNDWPAVTQCQLTALIREALEHWGRPATPPAPAVNHIPDATEMAPATYGARLRQCPTHGQQPPNAWGCPECLRELRAELARIKAPAADGEREELADRLGWIAAQLSDIGWGDDSASVARAAALLRQPAPAPVPVAERPWERDGWCDAEGRCWWFAPVEAMPGGFRSAGWGLYRPAPADEDTHCLPHWAIPQPPQGEEVAE